MKLYNQTSKCVLFGKPPYSNTDFESLNTFLLSFDWVDILSNISLDTMYNLLISILNIGINKCIPKKKNHQKYTSPWYNKRLTNLKNRKTKAFKRHKLEPNNILFKSFYLQTQKEFDILNKFLYKSYLVQTENNLQSNSKYFWSYVNSKRKTNGLPHSMYLNDVESSDTVKICEMFAKYFSSVFTNDIPTSNNISDSDFSIDISALNIVIADVKIALSNLDSKTSPGPDGIAPILLKKCASSLSVPIHYILIQSLSCGKFLDQWKISQIRL